MSLNRRLKHLPESEWPPDDRLLFQEAYTAGDIFDDDTGIGAHFSEGTRTIIRFGWRRWLGFLAAEHPDDLQLPAADRITKERVSEYVQHLNAGMSNVSVAITVSQLYSATCLIAPECDWSWLRALKQRLHARADPQDRFDRLVPAHQTLDLGIALMEAADSLPANGRKEPEIQYRDGLILVLVTLWLIRRRSLAALTLDRNVKRLGDHHIELLLFPEDIKSKRMESWPVPGLLLPYLKRYLEEIRPRLAGRRNHDAFWVGQRGNELGAGAIYEAVCRRTAKEFGIPVALHDFRRAAATFLAMEAPEKVGLTPGILQHLSPETADQHYNLARSVSASRRHAATVIAVRDRLRSTRA